MRRKIITVIVSLILCMTSVLPAAAMDGGDYIYDDNNMIGSTSLANLNKKAEMMEAKGLVPAEEPATEAQQTAGEHPPRLVDEADLLTDDEEGTLVEKLDTVSEKWQCDVAVVTVDSLGGKTATEFADDYFDYNGYGYGDNADGIMLVISMESRDWAITTHAFGIEAFTDAGQEYIMDKVTPPLGDGSYAKAFNVFADQCDDFLEKARAGEPYDSDNLPKESHAKLYLLWIIPCLIAGAIVAFIMTIKEKKSLKSVMKKAGAREYINGVKLSKKSDKFLYRNLEKVLIKTDDDGGSSTHVSSSGETHGGSSGKF